MIASAKARYLRMSSRKARMVLDLIRGLPTQKALSFLSGTNKRAARAVEKVLRSAIANAKNKGMEDGLYISKIYADEGPTWKRTRAASFGRANRINKRTCHVTICLDQVLNTALPKIDKAPKAEKPKPVKPQPKPVAKKKTIVSQKKKK